MSRAVHIAVDRKSPFNLIHFPKRLAQLFTKVNLVCALRLVGPTLVALTFAGVAHAQGTMDFTGAQTLMGTFKTRLIMQLLVQIRERGHSAIVYDPACEFVQRFYNPQNDTILNPLDARCPYWGPSEELRRRAEAKAIAASLYQSVAFHIPCRWLVTLNVVNLSHCLSCFEAFLFDNQQLSSDHDFGSMTRAIGRCEK